MTKNIFQALMPLLCSLLIFSSVSCTDKPQNVSTVTAKSRSLAIDTYSVIAEGESATGPYVAKPVTYRNKK